MFKKYTFSIYKNIEIIISDNNSHDKTLDICKKYKKKFNKIKIFKNLKNYGQGYNFYNVLKKSKGKYFMFQSSDDFRSPNFIFDNLYFLEKNNSYLGSTGIPILKNQKIDNKKLKSFKNVGNLNVKNFFKIKWYSHTLIYSLFRRNKILKFLKFLNE